MKKNVLIDLDRLKDLNTGLGQFALQFGTAISQLNDDKLRFTFLVPKRFNGFFGQGVDYENISFKRRYLPVLCRKYDVWHSIHQDSAFYPASDKTPLLLTIHDLNFLFEKDTKKAAIRLDRLQTKVDRANTISVISNFTKDTADKHLSLKTKVPVVIHNGVEIKKFEPTLRPPFVPEGKVLFCIGVVQEKKNQKTLLEMMKFLPDTYSLIIAGNNHGNYAKELQDSIRDLKMESRIVLPGTITDDEKYWCLTNCEALLFPSKYEGFGIPPIEAMRLGKPVFASTLSSIPEICGKHAIYWEHFEPSYMAGILLEGLKHYYEESHRAEQARVHSLQFTWNNKVQSYVQLYKQLLQI